MKRALFLAVSLLAIAPPPSFANDLTLKNKDNGMQLRLMDTPCSHGETLAILAPEWRPKFKNARILNAKGFIEFYGCWIQEGDDTAVVILQDGGTMALEMSRFTDPAI